MTAPSPGSVSPAKDSASRKCPADLVNCAAGDEIDVAILTKPRVDKLVREAKIVGGSLLRCGRDRSGGGFPSAGYEPASVHPGVAAGFPEGNDR